jgi:polyisoprenoid-binding protein YceI/predicted small lipoprotein YifL
MSKPILLLMLFTLLITACGTQTPTELPPEDYPAPQQTEPVLTPDQQVESGDSAYPPPFHTATPEIPLGTSYPAPEEGTIPLGTAYPAPENGLEVFNIVPEESEVKYEVGEVFIDQNNAFNLAVGVTSGVNGEILVDRANPANSVIKPISVDISQFTSDSQRRDNSIRERFLESSKYPAVEFTPQEIQGLPDSYQEGQTISFQVSGDLTIREVTKPVTFEVSLIGEGNQMTGVATTTILMSDFGFGPISILGILNTEDEVKVTFTFVARI